MNLTDEQLQQVEELSGLKYTPEEIAIYLGVNIFDFVEAFSDTGSSIYFHTIRGKLITKAQVEIELLNSAKNGNITAIQIIEKKKRRDELDYIFDKIDAQLG